MCWSRASWRAGPAGSATHPETRPHQSAELKGGAQSPGGRAVRRGQQGALTGQAPHSSHRPPHLGRTRVTARAARPPRLPCPGRGDDPILSITTGTTWARLGTGEGQRRGLHPRAGCRPGSGDLVAWACSALSEPSVPRTHPLRLRQLLLGAKGLGETASTGERRPRSRTFVSSPVLPPSFLKGPSRPTLREGLGPLRPQGPGSWLWFAELTCG